MRPAGAATVTVSNALLAPVELTLADGTVSTLAPGDSLRVDWSPGEAFDARWQLVRPQSADGRPMGEGLSGTLHERKPRGEVHQRIEVGALEGEYFAPRVTNASGMPVRFTVEGQGGAPLCNCEVAPGSDAVAMGYYRVGPRTVVRLRDGEDREVEYEMPHPIRERYSGGLTLRVDAGHLPDGARMASTPSASRRPVPRTATRATPPHRDVLGATARPAPVDAEPPVPVAEARAPEPMPEPAPTPAAAPAPKRTSANPASGFLPVR
jgi:hypothetical protein